jgi:hypothetical protein
MGQNPYEQVWHDIIAEQEGEFRIEFVGKWLK